MRHCHPTVSFWVLRIVRQSFRHQQAEWRQWCKRLCLRPGRGRRLRLRAVPRCVQEELAASGLPLPALLQKYSNGHRSSMLFVCRCFGRCYMNKIRHFFYWLLHLSSKLYTIATEGKKLLLWELRSVISEK